MRLIVGINSDIGRAVESYWIKNKVTHHASTRNQKNTSEFRPYIDLTKEIVLNDRMKYDSAVLCAGITRLATCRNDPIGTRKINVEGTLKLARHLSNRGIQVILLSTDKVYDGLRQYRLPEEEVSPVTEYGIQKAEAEKGILALSKGVVLRVAKVVYPSQELLSEWVVKLKTDKMIAPFSDMWFAPVSMNIVCRVIDQLIASRANGIWHVSSTYEITYEAAACHIANCLGADPKNIKARSFRESGRVHDEEVPRYTSLDMKKTSRLGILPQDPIETLHASICLSAL